MHKHYFQTTKAHYYPSSIEEKPSTRRALGSPAFHLAVVKFFCNLPLVSCRAMAICVQLDLPLGSPFSTSVAGVLEQVIIVILIVISFLERNKSFHVCCHLETGECSALYTRRVSERVNRWCHPVFIYMESRDQGCATKEILTACFIIIYMY